MVLVSKKKQQRAYLCDNLKQVQRKLGTVLFKICYNYRQIIDKRHLKVPYPLYKEFKCNCELHIYNTYCSRTESLNRLDTMSKYLAFSNLVITCIIM